MLTTNLVNGDETAGEAKCLSPYTLLTYASVRAVSFPTEVSPDTGNTTSRFPTHYTINPLQRFSLPPTSAPSLHHTTHIRTLLILLLLTLTGQAPSWDLLVRIPSSPHPGILDWRMLS